jgi:hypothetical protein
MLIALGRILDLPGQALDARSRGGAQRTRARLERIEQGAPLEESDDKMEEAKVAGWCQ